MARFTQKSFQELFEEVFYDTLNEQIDETSYDIEGAFISAQTIDTIGMSPKQIGLVQDLNVRAVVSEICAANVTFKTRQLSLWIKDAKSFSDANVDHTDFVRLFAFDNNYDIILSDIIIIDPSPNYLKKIVMRDTSIDIDGRLPSRLSSDFLKILSAIVRETLPPALSTFAVQLKHIREENQTKTRKKSNLKKIGQISSYKDTKGALSFRASNDRIYLGSESDSQQSKYKRLVEREIRKISDSSLSARIGNKDPDISILIREYIETYENICDDNDIVLLSAVSGNIADALQLNLKNPCEDERIDTRDANALRQLLTTNAIFVNTFPIAQSAFEKGIRAGRGVIHRVSD